jgi:hypothetical protein
MSSSQAASKPALKLFTAGLPPDLLRCARARLSSLGHKAAAVTSRSARACSNAACAPLTLWFAVSASTIRRLSSGSSKRSHHVASDDASLATAASLADQVEGITNGTWSASCCGSDVQAHSSRISAPATLRLRKALAMAVWGSRDAGFMIRRGVERNDAAWNGAACGRAHAALPPLRRSVPQRTDRSSGPLVCGSGQTAAASLPKVKPPSQAVT